MADQPRFIRQEGNCAHSHSFFSGKERIVGGGSLPQPTPATKMTEESASQNGTAAAEQIAKLSSVADIVAPSPVRARQLGGVLA